MPLPAALLAKLAKRGIVENQSGPPPQLQQHTETETPYTKTPSKPG